MNESKKTLMCPRCGKDLERSLLAYDGDKPVYVINCVSKKCFISTPIFNQDDSDKVYSEIIKEVGE